jgi:hypothetical protein
MTTPSIPVDFRGDGVLWLVNRTVFHPLGFALGQDRDTGEFKLYGDGTELWSFADSLSEDERFSAVQTLLQRARELNGEKA